MLKIRNLKFRYAESPFSLEIPHLDVAEGQHTAITGASGCGKTTLLNLLAGIIPLDLFPSSQICVAGESLSEKSEADLRRYRNETLGFVFQDFRLIEYLSLKDNILLPFTLSSRPVTTEINQRCDDLIQRIGLSTHGARCVTQLSRGEQQRVVDGYVKLRVPGAVSIGQHAEQVSSAGKTIHGAARSTVVERVA